MIRKLSIAYLGRDGCGKPCNPSLSLGYRRSSVMPLLSITLCDTDTMSSNYAWLYV